MEQPDFANMLRDFSIASPRQLARHRELTH